MAFRIQRHRLEATPSAHFVTGYLDNEPVRFAIARDASERLGWNPCLEEALRRLRAGERNFMVAYGVPRETRDTRDTRDTRETQDGPTSDVGQAP
jgi:hypothetical protein